MLFSPSIFENIVEICGPTFKIQGFSLYGNLYYWDIARTFPVQKSCAAFFAGTDSCLFTFSNGTKTCLFVFAGALKRPIGKNKKSFSSIRKSKKKNMFRQKKLNRFLYRNVRAMSLCNTESTHRNSLKFFKVSTHHITEPTHRELWKSSKSTHTTVQIP